MLGEANFAIAFCVLCALAALTSRAEGIRAQASDARLDELRNPRDDDFTYEGENGPDMWPTLYPGCGGNAQSPVDIPLREAEQIKFKSPLMIPDFDWAPSQLKILNNGHTVQLEPLNPELEKAKFLRGGPLKGDYYLMQFHFHWGQSDNLGSEHAIDGDYHAMEMHMVFSRKTSRQRPKSYRQGTDLAVIAVFLELSARDGFQVAPIVSHLSQVVEVGSEVLTTKNVRTDGLVPCSCCGVLMYNGSLTIPPCSETVTWLVCRRSIFVSSRQVAEFRKVKTATGQLTSNRRPVQPLNRRAVYKSCSAPVFSRPRTRCGPLLVWMLSLCSALYS